jgi:hypothetical protein
MKNLKNFQFLFPQLFINLLFSMSCFASIYPQFAYKPPVSKLELTSGFNFTSIKQIENSNSGTPFLGIRLQMPLNKEFFLETGAELAYFEYSSFTAFPKIRNTYLRFKIVPQFKINNFMKFGAGLQRSFLFSSNTITLHDKNWNGSSYYNPKPDFGSTLDYFIGFDIDLYNRVGMGVNLTASLTDPAFTIRNFQFSVHYTLNGESEKKPSQKDIANQQIKDLKNGVLLVRLKTSTSKIKALQKAGYTDEAARVEQEQLKDSKEIMQAFADGFSFCQVRFFTSDKSLQIRNRMFKNVFVDEGLKIDSTIVVPEKETFFIADFDYVSNDTAAYFSNYKTEQTPDGPARVPEYYGGTEIDFSALVISDSNFIQLQKPFPFYTRTAFKSYKENPVQLIFLFPVALISDTWSYADVVKKMDKKLLKFYSKSK